MQAAFFDLDKTVIARASMVAFGRPFYRHGLLSRRVLLRALWGQLVYLHLGADEAKLARIRESVLALTKGWEQSRVRAIVRDTLEEVVDPIIYSEALELIEEHRAAGRRVFIVSASPEEIVAPLAQYLGVDEMIATRARIEGGRYTGETEFYAYGPEKAVEMRRRAAAQGIDLLASYAYSDSATDLPMLEVVGHPVVVNPDRELARAAEEHGWEVRLFSRPVRLRDRMPVPPPGPTIGGSVVLAAAGGAVWWWLRRQPPPAPPPSWWDRAAAVVSQRLPVRRLVPSWPRRHRGRSGSRAGEPSSWPRRLVRTTVRRSEASQTDGHSPRLLRFPN